jgi:hypothetical protein
MTGARRVAATLASRLIPYWLERTMAEYETNSIPTLIRSILDDTRDLIRDELALARAEILEELSAVQAMAFSFATAAVAVLIGGMLLCITIGGAIAYFAHWPAWIGYAIVAILLFVAAFGFIEHGRSRLAEVRPLPKTAKSLKENLAWIQRKSSVK